MSGASVDCPCGFGKGIPASEGKCHVCGTDVSALHRLAGLPDRWAAEACELLAAGRFNEAEDRLLLAAAVDPTAIEPRLALARLYRRRGWDEPARARFLQVLALAPTHAEATAGIEALARDHRLNQRIRQRARDHRLRERRLSMLLPALSLVLGLLIGLLLIPSWTPDKPQPIGTTPLSVTRPEFPPERGLPPDWSFIGKELDRPTATNASRPTVNPASAAGVQPTWPPTDAPAAPGSDPGADPADDRSGDGSARGSHADRHPDIDNRIGSLASDLATAPSVPAIAGDQAPSDAVKPPLPLPFPPDDAEASATASPY